MRSDMTEGGVFMGCNGSIDWNLSFVVSSHSKESYCKEDDANKQKKY